jgi:clan AA aspartic protease (TIGR02281 family)
VPHTEFSQNSSEHSDTPFAQESNQDSSQDNDITIPLEKIGGSFVVQVNLNNERTAHLIVDTGASMTVLSTNIAIDLGILGTTDNELLTVNTAGGSVQVNMNYLSSLTVGNAQAHNVAVAIHDLPDIPEQIEGLLGMSFLKHFLITLDAEHARLILRPKPSS